MKQTATEWLVNEINKIIVIITIATACSLSGCKASKPACDAYAQVK